MNSHFIKITLIVCLIFQLGCDIQFKRKAEANSIDKIEKVDKQSELPIADKKQEKRKYGTFFTNKDSEIIKTFYSNKANAIIRKELIRHSLTSNKQEKKLITGKIIPRDIQVIPLPLKLNKRLSSLPLDVIRVQVGTRVILMKVKTRKILDVIKI